MDNYTLSKIIVKYFKGIANGDELEVLNDWREADVENEKLFQNFQNPGSTVEDVKVYKSFDVDKVWEKVEGKIQATGKSRTLLYKITAAVAALFIGVTIVSVVYLFGLQDNSNRVSLAEEVVPGQFNAILKVANQNSILLSDSTNQLLQNQDVLLATIEGGKIDYREIDDVESVDMAIEVPHRAEYQFEFSDGTKVSMNAGSKIVFKHPFLKDSRKVYAEGEVFFEVSKDKKRPFIVQLPNDNQIEVLGTAFNVRAYTDDVTWQSVLVEGSVLWRTSLGTERLMEPGQLLNYNVNMGEIKISEVDVYPYIAWKDGKFLYDGLELSQIMNDLRRWYGVDVVFEENILKDLRFRVNIKRYENLNEILDLITLTEKVKFEFKESTIIVKKY